MNKMMDKKIVKEIAKCAIDNYQTYRTGDIDKDIYLLLNSCWGLVVAPVEYNKTQENKLFRFDLNNGWGIDQTQIKYAADINVRDVVEHLRDAISHLQFSYDKTTKEVKLWVSDSMLNPMKFEITLPFKDLESFVLNFAQYFIDNC